MISEISIYFFFSNVKLLGKVNRFCGAASVGCCESLKNVAQVCRRGKERVSQRCVCAHVPCSCSAFSVRRDARGSGCRGSFQNSHRAAPTCCHPSTSGTLDNRCCCPSPTHHAPCPLRLCIKAVHLVGTRPRSSSAYIPSSALPLCVIICTCTFFFRDENVA